MLWFAKPKVVWLVVVTTVLLQVQQPATCAKPNDINLELRQEPTAKEKKAITPSTTTEATWTITQIENPQAIIARQEVPLDVTIEKADQVEVIEKQVVVADLEVEIAWVLVVGWVEE